jgi:hypothetical protein
MPSVSPTLSRNQYAPHFTEAARAATTRGYGQSSTGFDPRKGQFANVLS